MLSKDQINTDIQIIDLALNKAYIVSRYLPKDNFQKLIDTINALSITQDNHILIRLIKITVQNH